MQLANLGANTDGNGVSAWDAKEVKDKKKTEARKDMPLQWSEAKRDHGLAPTQSMHLCTWPPNKLCNVYCVLLFLEAGGGIFVNWILLFETPGNLST